MISERQDGLSVYKTAPWPLLLGGAVIYNLSLYSLSTSNPFPLSLLLSGIILQAISVTIFMVQLLRGGQELTKRERTREILFICGLSLSLSFTRLSRYAGFNGFDLIYEGSVLQHVLNTGYWDPSLGYVSNYQSSLGITILPTITSGATGVAGPTVFLFQTFLLMALLPLAVQPVISRLTGNFKLGTFSSLLLVQNWFFYGQHLIGKTEVALLLSFLAFACLTRRVRGFQILGTLLSLGVVMSHYTIALFLLFILLSYFAFSKVVVPIFKEIHFFRGITTLEISLAPIAASVVLILIWLGFAAPLILPSAVSSVQQTFASLTQSASGQARPGLSLVTSSSAGPIVTGWFNFQNALLGLGGLYLLFRYTRGRVKGTLATWTLVGLSLIALLGAWVILPFLSVRVESTRVLQMLLPFTIVFLGVILVRISKITRIFARMGLAVVIVILALMLPMNLMVANQENNPLYHTADTLPLAKSLDDDSFLIPTYSNYAVMLWSNAYLPSDKPIEVDSVGRYAFITYLPFPPRLNFSQEQFPPYTFHRYTLLSFYFVNDGVWSANLLGSSVPISGQDSSIWFSQPTHNVLYSSPKFWVMSPCTGSLCVS